MLAVISPAKKLNFDPTFVTRHSQPEFLPQAGKLAKSAARLSRPKLAATMKLSPSLADLNYLRFQAYSDSPPREYTKQAALAFNGDTYIGLDAPSWDDDDLDYAQDHLRGMPLIGAHIPCPHHSHPIQNIEFLGLAGRRSCRL